MKNRGFTLIELAVVLSILLALTTIGFLVIPEMQERQRLLDEKQKTVQSKLLEEDPALAPTFAGLNMVALGVFDAGTGVAVIMTEETKSAEKALVQLIERRETWVKKFPTRALRIQSESIAHQTVKTDNYEHAWGNTLPYSYVITYIPESGR